VKLNNPNVPAQDQELTLGSKINTYDVRNPFIINNQAYAPPTGMPFEVRFLQVKVPYTGIPYDRKYFRFKLTNRPNQMWGYIVSAHDEYRTYFLERDLVYIRFRPSKKQAILVGDRFGIYREKGPITHPLNPDRPIGIVSEIIGEVEITSTSNDLATGIILDSYFEIVKGDKICLFTPRDKQIVPSKTHRQLVGTIIQSATRGDTFYGDNHNLENDIVFVDRGECDGMKDGMLVNVYRPVPPTPDPHFGREMAIPDRFLGEAMILKAFDKNSTLLITQSREEIMPGDIFKSVSE
jgi:hypothetical protein